MTPPTDTPDNEDILDDLDEGEHVLEFTPEEDATIEGIAGMVVDMMEDYGMDCDVHFPTFTMEIEYGATAEEIIEGYHDILLQISADDAPQA